MAQRIPASSIKSPQYRGNSVSSVHKDGAKVLNKILTPTQVGSKRTLNIPECSQSRLVKYALKNTPLKLDACACPHVIIADDDSFQHFYYQSLFQKSLDFGGVAISREKLRIHCSFSGEDLIAKFQSTKRCGCNSVVLVITDYQMGDFKLNGVSTAIKIREAGYKGHLLLRTSETEEFLKTNHADFDHLHESKVLNAFVDKADGKKGKEIVQNFLEESFKEVRGRN